MVNCAGAGIFSAIQCQSYPRGLVVGNGMKQTAKLLSVPGTSKPRATTLPSRKTSDPTTVSEELLMMEVKGAMAPCCSNSSNSVKTVSGVLFALKHWICKHFYVSYRAKFHYCHNVEFLLLPPFSLSLPPLLSLPLLLSLQHFREDVSLSEKLECLIEHSNSCSYLMPNEKNVAIEVRDMYKMQKDSQESQCPVMEIMCCKDPLYLVWRVTRSC